MSADGFPPGHPAGSDQFVSAGAVLSGRGQGGGGALAETDVTAPDSAEPDSDAADDTRLEDSKAAGGSATVDGQLRVGAGFTEDERPGIVRRFASLDARLLRFAAVDVDMELSIKDRERPGQKVTLECWIARMNRMVATSHHDDLGAALTEVRDDLRRQINDATTMSEPRNNRQRRATLPNQSPDGDRPIAD